MQWTTTNAYPIHTRDGPFGLRVELQKGGGGEEQGEGGRVAGDTQGGEESDREQTVFGRAESREPTAKEIRHSAETCRWWIRAGGRK